MGHNIQAILTTNSVDLLKAELLHLPVIKTASGYIIALHHSIIDFWAESLPRTNKINDQILFVDCGVVHWFASELGITDFAIVETDYFGGTGNQAATVYKGEDQIMPVKVSKIAGAKKEKFFRKSPINKALYLLGVRRTKVDDEFSVFELDKFRSFEDYFYNENDELLWGAAAK